MSDILSTFLNRQLSCWSQASERYVALEKVHVRTENVFDFPVRLQHNPARIVSTAAMVHQGKVLARPCFLCSCNRPTEQLAIPFHASVDFDILVNPYPITRRHFTIAAREHLHQDLINPADIVKFVDRYPGYAAFYNGSKAGASAPDHLHFQACEKDFLNNLIHRLEEDPGALLKINGGLSIYRPDLPWHCVHFTGELDSELLLWLNRLLLVDNTTLLPDKGLRNFLVWRNTESVLHFVHIPRASHRPKCYFADDESHRLISPGALDMCGTLILPRVSDFEKLTAAEIRKVYSEVSFDFSDAESFRSLMLL